MATYTAGAKVQYHANFNFENCVACGKDLTDNCVEILVDGSNVLLTAAQYSAAAANGEFVTTLPVGSTCVKKFASDVVAA